MQAYFYAMLHRMRYIRRWSLMRNTQSENIQEHTLEVAYLAHALALIRRRLFPQASPQADPAQCVLLALYHDAAEIVTGDLPTPVKYFNETLHDAFREVEEEAEQLMLRGVPEALRPDYQALLLGSAQDEDKETKLARRLVKAADTLSAYIKCLDEKEAGNSEFADAERSTRAKLESYELPELAYFIDHCLPAFGLTLDALRQGAKSRRDEGLSQADEAFASGPAS